MIVKTIASGQLVGIAETIEDIKLLLSLKKFNKNFGSSNLNGEPNENNVEQRVGYSKNGVKMGRPKTRKHKGLKYKILTCGECGKECRGGRGLGVHLQFKHGIDSKNTLRDRIYWAKKNRQGLQVVDTKNIVQSPSVNDELLNL